MELNHEERALRAALSQIETPAYDMEGAVRRAVTAKAPARHTHPLPRAALLAATLTALLAVGAAAVGISGLWARFFPNPVPQNAVSTIGVSQTSGEYTLTLEDAMVDNNGAILLLSLRRADGESIDPNAHLYGESAQADLLVDGNSQGRGGGFTGESLSADGKTHYFCYEASLENFTNKKLTFTSDGVVVRQDPFTPLPNHAPEESLSLSSLAEVVIPDLSAQSDALSGSGEKALLSALEFMELSMPLPTDAEFPSFRLQGIVMTELGPAAAVSLGRDSFQDFTCVRAIPNALVDARTGARYTDTSSFYCTLSDGSEVCITVFDDSTLTAADIPHLNIEFGYWTDKVLSDQPFSLTFTADSSSARIIPLNKAVTLTNSNRANVEFRFTELRISALGLQISMSDNGAADTLNSNIDVPVITLKDGASFSTEFRGGFHHPGDPITNTYYAIDENGARVFLDTDQISSVSLCGVTLWTAGDYILNVEDSMADDNGVILLLSLRRVDGGPVDPDASLRSNTIGCDLLVDGKSIGGGFQPSVLSEDGKTLYFCTESWTDGGLESIAGKTVTFKTGGAGIPIAASVAFPGRELTAPLAQTLPLAKEFPSFRYVGSEATDEGFSVTTTLGRDKYGTFTSIKASPITLTDSRDGKEYWSAQGKYITLPDGTPAYRALYQSCPLTEADIPYINATYGYTMDRVLSDAPMAFSFTLSDGSGRLVPMNQTVTVSGFEVHLTELRFSSIGLSLNMSSGTDACNALMEVGTGPVLTMKDGSRVETDFRGSGSNPDGPSSISFTFVNQKDERVFPDVSQIASISLGGAIIWQAS